MVKLPRAVHERLREAARRAGDGVTLGEVVRAVLTLAGADTDPHAVHVQVMRDRSADALAAVEVAERTAREAAARRVTNGVVAEAAVAVSGNGQQNNDDRVVDRTAHADTKPNAHMEPATRERDEEGSEHGGSAEAQAEVTGKWPAE